MAPTLGRAAHAAAISACVLSSGALSQEAGSTRESLVLEEVIVTARRVQESSQDVPISMAVYQQERLDDLNVISAVDLATYTPSLSANSQFGSENASLAIRGFKQDLDTAPSVGVYFADVVVPRGATQGTGTRDVILPGIMFDLQNLQVLKGPQGTLFGRNTTGGAVLLVPREPGSEFGGYLEASAGNYDMRRLQGAVDIPLADTLRLRLSADHQKRDGFVENILPTGADDFEDINYTALRASFVWEISDSLENYTIASWYESDTHGAMSKLIACDPTGYDPVDLLAGLPNFIGGLSCGQLQEEKSLGAGFYDIQTPVGAESKIDQWQLINTTTWEINDTLTLKGILSYAEYENTQRTGFFGTNWNVDTLPDPYPALFFRGAPAVFTAINAAPDTLSADQSTYTAEFQLQGDWLDERLEYQAGVYFEWSDPESEVGNQSPTLVACDDLASLDCIDPLGSAFSLLAGAPFNIGQVGLGLATTTFRNRAIYAQSNYSITNHLTLTAGLRYTWDEQRSELTHITTTFPVLPPYTDPPSQNCTTEATEPSCSDRGEVKSDEPTWLIGLDYYSSEDVMWYGKYARGYRAGGIVNRGPFDYRTFEPEELDNFEIGVKTSFRGAISATLNVAAFYNDLTNQQIQVGFGPRMDADGTTASVAPTTGIANAGDSEIKGVEVEATLLPMEGLVLNLNYTWLDAQIKSIEDISTEDPLYEEDQVEIEPGSPLWQTPENQLTLSARYTLPMSDALGQLSFGLTYVYVDEQLTTYVYDNPDVREIYGENLGELDSINLLSANINWEQVGGLPLDLSLFATNLTDEEYYGYVPGLGANGLETAVLGQPRMYGARLRYRFGE